MENASQSPSPTGETANKLPIDQKEQLLNVSS